MKSASWPRDNPLEERLLVIDARQQTYVDSRIKDLSHLLNANDLLVVNDAATLPASLQAGEVELRLLAREQDGAWRAVLFGAGDWRTATEERQAPPKFVVGERLVIAGAAGATAGFYAQVERVAAQSPRLVTVRFNLEGAPLWSALYKYGQMIQYAYLKCQLDSWSTQTSYSSRPWAVEMPSAGRPLSSGLLLALRRKGVALAAVTHAAGISSTGSPVLDGLLPLRERYDIRQRTIDAIIEARARGGRVLAVGTSVVRALEGCAQNHDGRLVAGVGETELVLGREVPGRLARSPIFDGLLSGMHEPSESHYLLLKSFAPAHMLDHGLRVANELGYLMHEFGDSCLILS